MGLKMEELEYENMYRIIGWRNMDSKKWGD